MSKFASLEEKLMATARGVLVLLGLVFLVFAIWWAVLSLPAAFKGSAATGEGDARRVSAAQAFRPDAGAFSTAVKQAQAGAGGVDTETFKLREAMKRPEHAAHYDKVIQGIRGFAGANAAQRERTEAKAEESGETLMAPAAFEAVDKYGTLCEQNPDAAVAASASANEDANDDAIEAANPNCGRVTVREVIADNLSSLLSQVDSDADKLSLHTAYITGLDQSVAAYLADKAAHEGLLALPTAQIARALVSAYGDQFSARLSADIDGSDGISKLLEGVNPVSIMTNPFVAGTLGFLALFAYLMMLLSMARIERHLGRAIAPAPADPRPTA